MAIVVGADFWALSVRVTILDTGKGCLGPGIAEYPLHRKNVLEGNIDCLRGLMRSPKVQQ
jgi:hypothetical protein